MTTSDDGSMNDAEHLFELDPAPTAKTRRASVSELADAVSLDRIPTLVRAPDGQVARKVCCIRSTRPTTPTITPTSLARA